jgi:integrase
MAMQILDQLPRFAGNPYVFAGRDGGPMAGISEKKASLEQRSGTSGWSIHDCRRTARSLLSQAGISRDISERILGHVVGSKIERTYDRHDYREEMAHGLRALASLIETIVNPPPANNVRRLPSREAKS